jgi:hypothetical protein
VVTGVTDNTKHCDVCFVSFMPVVNSGGRGLAIAFTDQATGPMAPASVCCVPAANRPANPRYGASNTRAIPQGPRQLLICWRRCGGRRCSYKDHGFGFSFGGDGGADATARSRSTPVTSASSAMANHNRWYMLSGYTDWRGRGSASTISMSVLQFKTKRTQHRDESDDHVQPHHLSKHIGVFLREERDRRDLKYSAPPSRRKSASTG